MLVQEEPDQEEQTALIQYFRPLLQLVVVVLVAAYPELMVKVQTAVRAVVERRARLVEMVPQVKETMVEIPLVEALAVVVLAVLAQMELGQTAGMAEQERHPQFLGHLFAEAVAAAVVLLLELLVQELAAQVTEGVIQLQQLMPLQT